MVLVAYGNLNMIFKLVIMILIIGIAYSAVSWAVFDSSLALEQRGVAAGSGIVLLAILMGVSVTCFCGKNRIRLG
jgi:hypothetical protein